MSQSKEQLNNEQLAGSIVSAVGGLHLTNLAVVPGISVTCDISSVFESDSLKETFNKKEKVVLLTSKKGVMNPLEEDLFEVCCLARIEKIQEMPNGGIKAFEIGRASCRERV